MTRKTLRASAKQCKINLQKKRKKSEIINIMFSFFRQLKNSDTDTFYYFVIDNVVKCGAVGLKDQENSDNLDSRLSSYRSTFARFKLINIIKFKDSNTVNLFESWVKQVLAKYSIGTI